MTNSFPGVYIGIMTPKKTPFLMAVVVAIFGLIWAQLNAPIHLKPLTNHLLDYPSQAMVTVLSFDNNIPRVTFSKSSFKLWQPFRPATIAVVKTKYLLEEDEPKKAKETPSIKTQVYQEINKDEKFRYGYKVKDEETYVDKANGDTCTDGQGTISGTYCAPSGGRYNVAIESTQVAANEFTQKVAEKIVTLSETEIAKLSGTTLETACPEGDSACQVKVGNQIVYTLASDALIVKSDKIALSIATNWRENIKQNDFVNLSADNLKTKYQIDDVSQLIANLDPQDQTKLNSARRAQTIINDPSVSLASLTQNLQVLVELGYYQAEEIPQITAAIQANQIKAFTDPSAKLTSLAGCPANNPGECRNLTWEEFLRGLGYDKEKVHDILSDRQTNVKNQVKLDAFLDPTKSPLSHAAQEQGQTLESYLKTIGVDEGDIKEVIQARQDGIADLALINDFANPLKSTPDIALQICGGDTDCKKNFVREDYLAQLHNQDYATSAKSAYQLNLFNFSKLVGDDSFKDLPVTIQNTLLNTNQDVQQAFAAYSFEKNKTPGTIVTPESSNQLALDFAKAIQANPNIIQEYSLKFADHKDLYNVLVDTTRLFALTPGEKNSVVIAQLKDAAIHSTFTGLSNNGKVVSWEETSPEVKQMAREVACADDKKDASLAGLCQTLKTKKPSEYLPGYSEEAVTLWEQNQAKTKAELDSKIQANSSVYLQQVFDQQIGANIHLSSGFSNVATLDNPTVYDAKLREDALLYAIGKSTTSKTGIDKDAIINKYDLSTLTAEQIQLANEYLDRQLVTETYKVGGGIPVGMIGFSAGMAACMPIAAALALPSSGSSALILPICGAVGAISGALASQIPVGEMTATEIQDQKAAITGWTSTLGDNKNVTRSDEMVGSIAQSLLINPSAWGDEGMGRSITTRDNQFALYDAINTATDGQLISQIQANPMLQANLAIQGQVLNQSEKYQNRQEAWAVVSTFAIAPLTGALNVSVGSQLAKSFTGRAITESGFKALNVLSQAPTFAASTALNQLQTAAQYNSTGGDATLLTTPTQVAWQVCIMSQDPDSAECLNKKLAVDTEIATNKEFSMNQAFYTDLLMQTYQTATSFRQSQAQYRAQIDYAESQGIKTTGRTLEQIAADVAHLNDPNLTAKLAAAELKDVADSTPIRPSIATDPITDVQLTKLQGVQSDPNTQLKTIATTNLESKPATRIDINQIPDPDVKSAATAFNNLIETFESAAGFPLYPEQVVELLSPNQIIQLKTENGGSLAGKTDVIMRILSVSESRSLILAKGETEAVGYVNDQMLSDSGKKFYGSQNTKGIYLDSQRGYLEIDFTRNSFDPKTASPMNTDQVRSLLAQSKTDPSLHLTLVGDRPNTVWTRLFGNTIDQGAFSNLLGRNKPSAEGVLFKEITQSTQHGKFLIIADEISDDIRGNFAVSKKGMALKNVKDPSLLGGLKSGSEALSVYEDAISGSTHQILVKARIAELEVGQSKSALLRGASNGQSVPVDLDTHARALSEIIDQTLSTSKERNNPLRQQLADISTRLKDTSTADAAITQLDTILSNNNKGDLAFDLSFRKASLQEDWNQLARVPDTDFGVEGKDLVLRKKSATTGERLSTATQLLSFYKQGKAMIDAFNPHLINAADTSQIPSLDSINIAPKGSQMDVATFYGELQAAGHQIRGLDATPQEALNALAINDTIKTKPLVPKNFGYGKATSEVITQFIQNRLKLFSKKASAIVLAGTNVDMDSDIKGILSTAHQNNADFDTLIITQYKQSPDGKTTAEYLQYQVKDGVIDHTKPPTNLGDAKTWNDTIQTQLKGSNPEKTLIIYKGRERAADLKVITDTHDNIRWSHLVDATGDDLPTSVNIEQMWRRDRTFSEDFDLYLATPKEGLTADNVWNFFEDNLYTKMASDRFADTIKALGSAPSYAIDNLSNIGDTLNLGFFAKRKLTNLQTTLKQQASSFESMLATATSRQPLPSDQLVLELYSRAKATNDQLLDMANNIGKTLGLDDTQLARVKTQLGAEDNFVELTPFLTELNTVTKSLETPKSQSPQDLLLAYAHNNSFDPSSSPQYRVVTESHLASSLTPANTATKPTTESPITLNRPTNPILDSIASLIQTPQNLLAAALRTASIIINPTIPVLDNQPITNILSQPDVTLSFLTSDDRTIALFRVNNTLYYQTDDSDPISLTTTADAISRLPSPGDISRIVLNDEDLDPTTYRAPTNPTISEKIIESTNDTLEDFFASILDPSSEDAEPAETPATSETEPKWEKTQITGSQTAYITPYGYSLSDSDSAPTLHIDHNPGNNRPLAIFIPNDIPTTTLITVNGQTRQIGADWEILLDYGDTFTFGDTTIKIISDASDANNKRTDIDWALTPDPKLDLPTQLDNASKLTGNARRTAITQFRTNLQARYQTIANLSNYLSQVIADQPTVTRDQMLDQTLAKAQKSKLTNAEINNLLFAVNSFMLQHEHIEALHQEYSTPGAMWEAAYGFIPKDEVQWKIGYNTINFITSDSSDFARAYKTDGTVTGKAVELTTQEVSTIVGDVGGFHQDTTTLLPNTENIFNVDRDDQPLTDTIAHEDQHSLFTTIQLALAPNISNLTPQSDQDVLLTQIADLYSNLDPKMNFVPLDQINKLSLTDDEQKQISGSQYSMQPTYIIRPNEIIYFDPESVAKLLYIYQGNNIQQFANLVTQLSFNERLTAENSVANEILAQITGLIKASQSWETAKPKVIESLKHSNYTYFIDSEGSTDEVISQALENANLPQYLSSRNTPLSVLDETNHPFREYTITKFYSAEAQEDLVQQAVDAYETIIGKGYSHDEATILLQSTRLAYWRSLARRTPALNTTVATSNPSIFDTIKKFFSSKLTQPTTNIYDTYDIDYSQPIIITSGINGKLTTQSVQLSTSKELHTILYNTQNPLLKKATPTDTVNLSIRFTDSLGLSETRDLSVVSKQTPPSSNLPDDINFTKPITSTYSTNSATALGEKLAETLKTILPTRRLPNITNTAEDNNIVTNLSDRADDIGSSIGNATVAQFNQILAKVSLEDVLTSRNQSALNDYFEQGRFLNPTINVSQEELVEIANTSSDPQLTSILSGNTNVKDLSAQLLNPGILGLRLLELQLHSTSFDQEASNVIFQRDSSLLMLDRNQTHGIYQTSSGAYSSGAELVIPGEQPLTRIHSHPIGTIEKTTLESRGQTIDPELLNRLGDLPSTSDLTLLLQKGKPEADFSCNSIIVVGPNTTTLIARTQETPAFIEYDKTKSHKLLEELETLGSPDGDILVQQTSRIHTILDKYHLVAYSISLDSNSPFSSWERVITPLPQGARTYADSIDIPYSQIELINTTTGADGDQFYQIRVNDAYDIGIDENGVAWGGGVQISDVDYLKRKEATVQAEKRILGAGVISSFNYNRYEYYQFNQVKTLARKIFDVEQNATQDEIKQAYRDTIRLFSPDINKSPNAEIIFKTINDAYTILRTDKILYDTKTIDGKLAIETAEISAMRELFDPDYQVSPQSPPDTAKNLSNIWPKEIVLGRNGRADIPVNYANSKMSARHFSLGRDQDGYYIKDLGSTNGTFVNGQRISSKRYLKKGDVITAEETFTVNNVVDGLELIHKRAQDILYFDANTGAFTLNKNVAISQVWPKEIIFGRSSTTADIIIADELISRNHFSLGRDGKGYYVKDLDSTNGTFVNGKEITPQTKQYLKTGDAISSDKYDLFDFSVKITSRGLELFDNISNKYLNFNQTNCSFCPTRISDALKKAAPNTPQAIRSALTYNNDHTFGHTFIQSTLNAVLYALMGNLTGNRTHYDVALTHLARITPELEQVKDELQVGTEIILASDLQNLDPTLSDLVTAIPVNDTPQADKIDVFNSKLGAAKSYIESKRDNAKPSLFTRLITEPLFSLRLSLNQSYGNLIGRGENDVAQLSPTTTQSNIDQHIGVGSRLERAIEGLQSNNQALPPNLSPEDFGTPGLFITNEWSPASFIDEVRKNRIPDGYLVGPTIGNIFSLLDLYSEDTRPKGLVITDINPEIILVGKMFVLALQQYETYDQTRQAIFNSNRTDKIIELFNQVISNEQNPLLKTKFENITPERRDLIIGEIFRAYDFNKYKPKDGIFYDDSKTTINVINAIKKHYTTLRELAINGNIGIVYGDISDPSILESIRDLPDYDTSTNVVYLSNIADVLYRIDMSTFELVEKFVNNISNYLHPVSDIVVLTQGFFPGTFDPDYRLRASYGMPTWEKVGRNSIEVTTIDSPVTLVTDPTPDTDPPTPTSPSLWNRAQEWVRNIPNTIQNYWQSRPILNRLKQYRVQQSKTGDLLQEEIVWDKTYNPILYTLISSGKIDTSPESLHLFVTFGLDKIAPEERRVFFTKYIPQIIATDITDADQLIKAFIPLSPEIQANISENYLLDWISLYPDGDELSYIINALRNSPNIINQILPNLSTWLNFRNDEYLQDKDINVASLINTIEKYPSITPHILPYITTYLSNPNLRNTQDLDILLKTLSEHSDIIESSVLNVDSWLNSHGINLPEKYSWHTANSRKYSNVLNLELNNLRIKLANDQILQNFHKPVQYLSPDDAQTELWQNITQKLIKGNFRESPDYYDLYLYKESHQSEWNQMAQKYPDLNSIFDGAEDAIAQHKDSREFQELYEKNKDKIIAFTHPIIQDMFYGYLPTLAGTHTQENLLYMLANTPNTSDYNKTYDKAMIYYLAHISNSIDYASKSKYLTNYRIIFQSNLSENTIYSLSRSPLMNNDPSVIRGHILPALQKLSSYIEERHEQHDFTSGHVNNIQFIVHLQSVPIDLLPNHISLILADPILLTYASGDFNYASKATSFKDQLLNSDTLIKQITPVMIQEDIIAKVIEYSVTHPNTILEHLTTHLDNPEITGQLSNDTLSYLQTFRDIPSLIPVLEKQDGFGFYLDNLKGKSEEDMIATIITELTKSGQIETAWHIMKYQFDQLIDSLPLDQQKFWRVYRDHPLIRPNFYNADTLSYFFANLLNATGSEIEFVYQFPFMDFKNPFTQSQINKLIDFRNKLLAGQVSKNDIDPQLLKVIFDKVTPDEQGLNFGEFMSWVYANKVDDRTQTPLTLMSWRIYAQTYQSESISNQTDFLNLCVRVRDQINQKLREIQADSITLPSNYRVSEGTEIEINTNGLQRTNLFNLDDYIKLKKLINQRKSSGSSSIPIIDSQIEELTTKVAIEKGRAKTEYQKQVYPLLSIGVGKGNDGTHEFANLPVADYNTLIWELSELDQLRFFSLHPQILQWIGERGIHITISGESGITADQNSTLLQNTLIATGYASTPLNGQGGIQDAEEKSLNTASVDGKPLSTAYSIARGLYLRYRPAVTDVFTKKQVAGVEFRINNISSVINLEKTLKAYNRLSIPLMVFQRNVAKFEVDRLMETLNDFADDPTLLDTILDDSSNDFLLPEITDPLERKLTLIWAYYRTQSIIGFEKYQKSGILPSPLDPPTSKQLITMDGELGQVFPTTEEGSSRLLDDAFASFHKQPPTNSLPWFMQRLVDKTTGAVEVTFSPSSTSTKPNFNLQALLPLPALTSLGVTTGQSLLSVLSPYIGPFIPNLPLLTYNTKTWIDNLRLVPAWLREWVQTSKQVWTNRHLTRVSLFPSNIVKMLNNPSLTKAKDIFGFEYSVRGKDGAIIKSGKLTEYTDIHLPATDDYNLTISGLTLSGADILAQYPDYQTYSWIDNAAINSVLILSVLGFGLGMITMLWTLADTVFKTQAGIYYFFVNTFGTNFANVVLGQFRDIFTLTGIFGMTFSMNRDLVYKFGKWFALFLINMFAVGWMGGEFWQANLRGDMVDIADLIAFSVVPISTIIYGAYSYIRYVYLPKIATRQAQ